VFCIRMRSHTKEEEEEEEEIIIAEVDLEKLA
jgi:hypothetical protein